MKMARILAVFTISVTWACAMAQDLGEEDIPQVGPTIEAFYVYLAPTMARLHGDGFEAGATLWLDVISPEGNVATTQVAVEADGRFFADVAVDEPGEHKTRIRDGAGQVLSEGNLLVGVQ